LEEKLPKQALVSEGYFVHFERSYKISDSALLLKCAFGSFDRPEHKYILIDNNNSRYFASAPVKTTVNHAAHKKIVALLSEKENNV
jgi:tRNA (guanine-N7-)-methyltransferase